MAVQPDKIKRRMNRFLETCGRVGLRITPQRTEIFRKVASTAEHPDAETIHRGIRKRMPHVSLDTVYRTLHRLAEEGIILELQLAGGPVRFDANMVPHGHFMCTACGLIRDFPSVDLADFKPPQKVRNWGELRSSHLEIRGICAECLARCGRQRN